MAGNIPQDFIDDLLDRIDIVELIDSHVPLRKAGKNHLACCPFHDEKTPSFTVNQDKQFYHCFGCGVSGTAISFLMEYSRLGFVEAIENLAHRAGLELPHQGAYTATGKGFAELHELLEKVAGFYQRQLRTHPQAGRAVNYLKQRGVSGEYATEFELGFAPPGWDTLIRELGASDERQKSLARTGMLIQRDDGDYYDRFRERIMFPIRDRRGRMIGFGGRSIGEGTPKYLNSPETPVFHKGRELYGLYRARQKNRILERMYIVEGYMDVLALGQYGINNAVAALGTATTNEHLGRLFKLTPQLVFCFDGDEAGRKAALRAMATIVPLLQDGRQVFFKFLPDGEDPDDYVRKNGKATFADPNEQLPLSDFMINTAKGDSDLSTAEGSSLFINRIRPELERLPEGVFRKFMLRRVEKLIGLPIGHIESKTAKEAQSAHQRIPRRPMPANTLGKGRIVSAMITRLLYQPGLAGLIEDTGIFDDNPLPGTDFLKTLVELIHNQPQITCAGILENWRGSQYEARLGQLASNDEHIASENMDLEAEFLDMIAKIRMAAKRKNRAHLAQQVQSPSQLSDSEKALLRQSKNSDRSA